ncbi:MAG: RNA-binding protein [Gammaproteobacteria bacterium]
MGRKLYVGNLPYTVNEQDLSDKFAEYGTVESAKLISDRDTGRSKGFGFIEMASDSEAQAAIEGLNGVDYDGRPMKVNEARPRDNKRPGGGGYGGGGGGGGGGRGGYGGGGNRW